MVFYGHSGFLPNKTARHDITEILLKVALNIKTHHPTLRPEWSYFLAGPVQIHFRPMVSVQRKSLVL